MKRGLVLGGGGLVGLAYHAGALKALDDWGIDPAGFDLIIGTSAGSIIGSYLRCGWTASDFYDYAHGRHPKAEHTEDEERAAVRDVFVPLSQNRVERVRRSVGSMYAVASSRGLWRGLTPAAMLRKAFPAGIYSTEGTKDRLDEDLPQAWPARPLYVCVADLYSGKRVPLGRRGSPECNLPTAVLASTSIPGVFPPVRIGSRHYVDGGIVSATSLDLAVEAGCDSIVCVAPLGYRAEGWAPVTDPKMWGPMLSRNLFARTLRKEVRDARARGIEVLVVRPWLWELKDLGTNAMRHFDRRAVADAARRGTLRVLEERRDHPALRSDGLRDERAG